MGKPSINGPFSMAMLNNQRVRDTLCNTEPFIDLPSIIAKIRRFGSQKLAAKKESTSSHADGKLWA